MSVALSKIIKDVLSKIPTLETRINILSTKISNISSLGGGASGTWAISISGKAASAKSADAVAWANVTGKPETYPPSSHGNHVPKIETTNNARFLRNDNTWQAVTPANIGAPTKTGAGASGTWNINITGNSASAAHANNADVAKTLEVTDGNGTKSNGVFYWIGKDGQPAWLWGANTKPSETYVYNPSNFHVAAANNDGNGANIANTYLKRSGGTMTGPLNFANGTWNLVGDDSYVGDHNISGTFCVKGANGETGIALVNTRNESDNARISYGGGYINFNKKIAANLAGNADTATTANTGDWQGKNDNRWYQMAFSLDSEFNWNSTGAFQYNPASNVLKVGTVQGNITGNAGSANALNQMGKKTAIKDGTKEPWNLSLYKVYNNGYPVPYGNLLSIGGDGGGELLAEWSGSDKGIGHLHYRNRRDAGNLWSDWRTVAFTSDINSFAPTKTGAGASGTWGINITGNATTATTATNVAWSGVTGKPNLALKDGDTIYTNDWFRSRGSTGWYNESYGGGWYMTDSTWIRAFNNKSVYTPAKMQADGGFYGNLQGTATNADTVDGYHASDLLRTLGNKAPVMTDIFDRAGTIDLSAMNYIDIARHKANINKAPNMTQNLWYNTTGIHSYGGDVDMANGYARGTLKLTQSYKNFDKILVVASNDDANTVFCKLWDVYELAYMFSHSYKFSVCDCAGLYWYLFGSVRTGTATNYVLSTDTIWSCGGQNCGIIAIYGLSY